MMIRICVWGCLLVWLTVTACTNKPDTKTKETIAAEKRERNKQRIANAAGIIQTGDLVLRSGTDFASTQTKNFSVEDKTYSHAGIAWLKDSAVYIIHVMPDTYRILDKVRIEPLDSFANPADNKALAVARYQLTPPQVGKLMDYLQEQYQRKIPFDTAFDLASNNRMYCSEMISKGISYATADSLKIPVVKFNDRTKLKLIRMYFGRAEKDVMNLPIIPIDRLYKNKFCTLLQQYHFEQ